MSTFDNLNTFALLDMSFSELHGVKEEYDTPEDFEEILWVIRHSTFISKRNGESGILDHIFNLGMLEDYIEREPPLGHLKAQLTSLHDEGYSYILFHQGT